MFGSFDRHFDLNLVEEASIPSQDNIWRQSFISPTGPLTVWDSVMKNDMTAAVVARNLVTPKDNRLLFNGSVSNMAQRLFARTRQVESLAAEVMSLKQEIRGLKHENKQLHRLRFVGLFQKQLHSSSRAVPLNEAPNDQLLMPSHSGVPPTTEAPNDHPPVPFLSGAPPTTETSSKQPL
ncbi:unnamed protein product [Malus baccata var. baccata]